MNPLDEGLFRYINHWPDSLAPFYVFCSKGMDSWWVRGVLLVLIIVLVSRKQTRKGALVAALLWPLADGLTKLLKDWIPVARPTELLRDVIPRIDPSGTMGTASAHSANMMFIAVVFAYYYRWWGSPWFLVALFVGISRVYVGAHFPSQVLLGWFCGALCAALAILAVEKLSSKFWPSRPSRPSESPSETSGG